MTPAARISAAIEVLDQVAKGYAAERALTNWARGSRFAGSKDRAAVRDHVFDALRRRRSCAFLGGGADGRAVMLGSLRAQGADPALFFNGEGHAPAPQSEAEQQPPRTEMPRNVRLDIPDWLAPPLMASLSGDFEAVCDSLRHRAPVFLRVNLRAGTRDDAVASLAAEGIVTVPHPLSNTALDVTENARRIQNSQAYTLGLVELQDAASQAITDMLPLRTGARVLDYCAGGGGKTLAMAARADATFFAHDIESRRMADLPVRAARAGVEVTRLRTSDIAGHAPFDLVLLDVPCSGSGSWRRAPEAKWLLTDDRLRQLVRLQGEILDKAAGYVAKGGVLAYATCSLLKDENASQIDAFLSHRAGWKLLEKRRLTPIDGGDGFFIALLTRV
ncbi:RsmB/NOP family class I SAM-dependent RNA methyltransferase [Pseudogemmobacter sp. W21_MBD1_M6]|uniref:RsmB/NOP family class I SAM-dependent RNA methyltransferase n=1 Tax=Pseudogemmobacter sp. W21_MBD1_M6 TaxID=3240271 RepID=UPI003F96B11C